MFLLCPAAVAQDRPVPAEIAQYQRLLDEGDAHLKAERFAEALAVFESLVSHADEHESLEQQLPLALARVAESCVGVGSSAKAKGLAALDRMVEIDERFGEDERVIAWRRALEAMADPEPPRPPGPSAEELAQRERKMAIFAMDELLDRVARPGLTDADRKRHIDALWVYLRPVLADPLESDIEVWLRAGRFALEVGEQGPVIDCELAAVCGEAILRLGGDAHLQIVGRLQAICGKEAIERIARLRERHSTTFHRATNSAGGELFLAILFDSTYTPWEHTPVLRHDEAAVLWYRKAANQGVAEAQSVLGIMYQTGRGVTANDTKAIKWFRKAAEQGNTHAQFNLGMIYESGRGVNKNDAEAVNWFRKAADQGHARAQYSLGWMYHYGRGVVLDEPEAIRWYRKAAEQGVAEAQSNLGAAYRLGLLGLAKNEKEAAKWLLKAAQQGDALAQSHLGGMYSNGVGVPKNKSEAAKWYRKAAEQEDVLSQVILGTIYEDGIGVPMNEAEAVKWYRRAADRGNASGQACLGAMYASGRGVHQNDAEAVKWFRKAADQEDARARYLLGLFYATGRGVRQNQAEGVRLLKLAARQGYIEAQQTLREWGESW